jgi:hypothetical protein
LLGDIGNRLDIEDTERDIKRLRQQLSQNTDADLSRDERLDLHEQELAQLGFCVAVVVKALQRKGMLSDEEIQNLAHIMDEI